MLGKEATNRIHSGYAEMPAQMQAAARFVLDHPQDVVLLSMRALARRAGVPAATMTRMAQRVGYAGFDDLRAVYLNDARAAPDWFSSKAQGMLNRRDAMGEPALVGDLAQSIAGNTADLADDELRRAVARASDLLMAADRIFCVGARSAYPVVFVFSHVLGYFWPAGRILGGSRGELDFDTIFDITAGDAVLAASFNPYARSTVDAVGIAADAGATIVSITDSEVDGIDPTIMPAVAGPAPGGVTFSQARDPIHGLVGKGRVVGMDIVEICPSLDVNRISLITAARLFVNMIGASVRAGYFSKA